MTSKALLEIRQVTLYLLVIMSGLSAGIHFYTLIAPVSQKMSILVFTEYWQIVDGYMGQRMPIFGKIYLTLFVINILLFIKHWRSLVFSIILICFLINVFDVILTIKNQLPINKFLQSVDVKKITEQQLKTIEESNIRARQNFSIRKILSIVSFALLSITPFLLSRHKSFNA